MKYILMAAAMFLALLLMYEVGFYRGYVWGYADGVIQCVSVMQGGKDSATQKNFGI